MARVTINPDKLFNSTQYGFSQISISSPGKNVYISGQVAWDKNENIVGENNLEIQTRKALDNLSIAIESAGGTMEDIMMLRIYVVDFKREYSSIISAQLINSFGTINPPASTWISVAGLANDEFMIEIEAQAVI